MKLHANAAFDELVGAAVFAFCGAAAQLAIKKAKIKTNETLIFCIKISPV